MTVIVHQRPLEDILIYNQSPALRAALALFGRDTNKNGKRPSLASRLPIRLASLFVPVAKYGDAASQAVLCTIRAQHGVVRGQRHIDPIEH
jgi:hypothetical protein